MAREFARLIADSEVNIASARCADSAACVLVECEAGERVARAIRKTMDLAEVSGKVQGLEGLRVVDGSIMPVIPGGNTMAPSIMIGEKGADLVKECPKNPVD